MLGLMEGKWYRESENRKESPRKMGLTRSTTAFIYSLIHLRNPYWEGLRCQPLT